MHAPMRASLAAVAVVLVALTSLAAPVAAGAAAGHKVPFKGSVEGVELSTPIDSTHLRVTREGTGNATQLGRFTVKDLFTVDLSCLCARGTFVFTAANGDTVAGRSRGQATPVSGAVLSIVETGIITDGTGRFAGATGTFTSERLLDGVTGLSTGSFTGTISSPGASKH